MGLSAQDAVILFVYGTVERLEELPAFLTQLRRGRPPSDDLVATVRKRYETIGGSPLWRITQAQAHALARRLGAAVTAAMRLWRPSLVQAAADPRLQGCERLCVLPLAPFSPEEYCAAAESALGELRAVMPRLRRLVTVGAWGSEPLLVGAHVAQIRAALHATQLQDAPLLATAHSVPESWTEGAERYRERLLDCVQAIGSRLGRPLRLCFQSRGAAGGSWIGPDLRRALEQVAGAGHRQVVVVPIGFLAEHLETLYDLDIEAASWAAELGLGLRRLPALGVDPGLIEALASVAERALG